jgi:iron(III) transport system substrate-binding protein
MRTRRLATVALLVLTMPLVTALATGCTSSGPSVTIYSGRSSDLIGPILDDFAAETGTDVRVKYGDSAELALLIAEEGDKSPADVFVSQTPGAIGYLDEQGLLAELSVEVIDLAGPGAASDDGRWVGLSGRRRVIVYNADMADPQDLPDSVLDLTEPEYEGMVGVAPSNGSFQDFVSAMRIDLGDEATAEWLAGMADNDAQEYGNNNAIVEAVARGEIPMGLVNHYYNERLLAEDPDAPSENYYLPATDVGSLLIVTAAAVLESSDDKEVAEELVSWLLAEPAQTYFTEETFEYPLAVGVDPNDVLEPFEADEVFTVDYAALGADFETTLDLIRESGLGD